MVSICGRQEQRCKQLWKDSWFPSIKCLILWTFTQICSEEVCQWGVKCFTVFREVFCCFPARESWSLLLLVKYFLCGVSAQLFFFNIQILPVRSKHVVLLVMSLRRSSRLRSKKPVFDYADIDNHTTPKINQPHTSKSHRGPPESDDNATCRGCNLDFSHLKPSCNANKWIECNKCGDWWHTNCAGVSLQESVKFKQYHIKYTCAICVYNSLKYVENSALMRVFPM